MAPAIKNRDKTVNCVLEEIFNQSLKTSLKYQSERNHFDSSVLRRCCRWLSNSSGVISSKISTRCANFQFLAGRKCVVIFFHNLLHCRVLK